MLSFWVKISEGKTTKLSSLMYKIIYKLHLVGSYDSPWLMCIKRILCNSGNPNYWYQQDLLVPKAFMKNVVCLQLESQYLQLWQAEVNRNRKCITYRIFKDQLVFNHTSQTYILLICALLVVLDLQVTDYQFQKAGIRRWVEGSTLFANFVTAWTSVMNSMFSSSVNISSQRGKNI